MKKSALVFLCLLLVSICTQAQQGPLNSHDFTATEAVINARVPVGTFKGLPLNTAIRRPVQILGLPSDSPQNIVAALNGESVEVSNFFHDGKFYVAKIPIAAVDQVYLLTAPFSPIASHTMLRFLFREGTGIELTAEIMDRPSNDGQSRIVTVEPLQESIKLKDLVVTVDGTEPRGQKSWNMGDAIRGRYTITYRLVSIRERFRWFVMSGTPIHQTELNLTPAETLHTLQLALFKSHTIKFTTPYSLLRANCTNLALHLVKEAVPFKSRSMDKYSPMIQTLRAFYDRMMPITEALTWFTPIRLWLLGWKGAEQLDLQKDPEFRGEMQYVIEDFRRAVSEQSDLSPEQKNELIDKLGIGEGEPVLNNPKAFRKALDDFETMKKRQGAGSCKSLMAQ